MRCLACGADMTLVNVVVDDTMMSGFERHTFRCSSCGDIEQRLAFNNQDRRSNGQFVSPPVAPVFSASANYGVEDAEAKAPSVVLTNQPPQTHSFWRRLFAKIGSN